MPTWVLLGIISSAKHFSPYNIIFMNGLFNPLKFNVESDLTDLALQASTMSS